MSKRILSAAIAVLALAAAPSQAAFTRLSAGAGEARDFLATSSTTMFAATQGGGLYRTTDTGANWSWVSTFGGRYVWKLAQSPAASARLYAATETGIYRSTDTGATWTQITYDPARTIAVSPGSTAGADTILAGVRGTGLLKSTDSGATWTRVGNATFYTAAGLEPIAIGYASATNVFAAFYCNRYDFRSYNIENFGGVFQSTDSGSNWTSIQTIGAGSIPTKCVTSLAVGNTTSPAGVTVLAGTLEWDTNDGKIYRSFNGGAWNNPTASADGWWFGLKFLSWGGSGSPNTFWGGTRTFGVVKSTTAGQAGGWTQPGTTNTEVLAVAPFTSGTTLVAALKGQGLVRSTTGAAPFTVPAGFTADRVRGLANHANVAPNTFTMAVSRGGFARSTNAGSTWSYINTGLADSQGDIIQESTAVAAHPSNVNVVYGVARPQDSFRGGVYAYNGTTWSAAFVGASPPQYDHASASLAIKSDGTTYYAAFNDGNNGGGLYRGASAATFAATGYPLNIYESPGYVAPGSYRVRQSAGNANLVFLVMYDSLPYRSTSNGGSWARVSASEASASFMRTGFFEIAEKPGSGGAVWVASTNKGLYRTVDSGATWSRLATSGLANIGLQAMAYSANGILWVGTRAGQVYCSANDGVSFTAASLGALPPVAMVEAVLLNSQVHFLTDGGGVYRNDTSTTCP